MPARADLAGRQRVGQRRLVDQAAAGGVDDDHARAWWWPAPSAPIRPSVSGVFGRWMVMKSRLAEQLLQRHQPDAELRGAAGLDVGVVGDQRDAEGGQPLGDQDADPAEPDDADGLVGDLDAHELRPLPRPLAQGRVGGGDLPGRGEQQRDGVLGGADDVRRRRVDDHDAALGRRGDVDVVQADAGAGDHLQVRRGGQGLGVDLGGAPDHHRRRVGESREQRRPVGAVDVPDLDVAPEHLQDARGQLFGDQDDGQRAPARWRSRGISVRSPPSGTTPHRREWPPCAPTAARTSWPQRAASAQAHGGHA